jgi:hypothetical protein
MKTSFFTSKVDETEHLFETETKTSETISKIDLIFIQKMIVSAAFSLKVFCEKTRETTHENDNINNITVAPLVNVRPIQT